MKFKSILYSKKWAQVAAAFMIVVLAGVGVFAKTNNIPVVGQTPPQQPITLQGKGIGSQLVISQTKVLQGSDGEVYLKLTLTPDAQLSGLASERKPTDFVVVLDRSGSMSEKNKMDYAHKAIESLLAQMKSDDRFTLVTFDNVVETPVRQEFVSKGAMNKIMAQVHTVTPRGGTNLAEGLLQGVQFLKGATTDGNRVKRLIMISDGNANIGITNPSEIGQMAKNVASGEFAISTIGVGLDYNEQIMANIADYGMGNYHFLDKISDMDKILAGEFLGASQVVAQNLAMQINLNGVELVDASGYPIEKNGTNYTFKPGHLYANQTKVVYLTLKVPTQKLGEYSLGVANLSYRIQDQDYVLPLMQNSYSVACLPAEKNEEVVASIDKEAYGEAWQKNNYGGMLKTNASSLGRGDTKGAMQQIQDFKQKLQNAMKVAPSPAMEKQMDELEAVEKDVQAAENSPDDQKYLGKKYYSEGTGSQRK